MTADSLQFSSGFLSQMWKLFTCFYIPGTNLTPAGLSIGLLVLYLIIKLIRQFSSAVLTSGGDEK